MERVPDDIMQRLVMFCQEHDIGLAYIGSDGSEVQMIIMGSKQLTPTEASIMCAHILLTGILSGGFEDDNDKRTKEDNKPIPKLKLM